MTQWRPTSTYTLPTTSTAVPPPPPTPNPVEQAQEQRQRAIVPYQQPQDPSRNPFAAFGSWAFRPLVPESAVAWMPDWIEPVGRFATRMTSPAEIAFTVGTLGWGAGAGAALRGATAARGPIMSRLGRATANIVEPVYRGTPLEIGQATLDARRLNRTFGSVPTSMKNIIPRTEAELYLIGGSQAAVEAIAPPLIEKFGPVLGTIGTIPAALAGGVAGAVGGPALRSSVAKATKRIASPLKSPKGDSTTNINHGNNTASDPDKPDYKINEPLMFRELGSEVDAEKKSRVDPLFNGIVDRFDTRVDVNEMDRTKQQAWTNFVTTVGDKISGGRLGKPMADFLNKHVVRRGAPSAGSADRADSMILATAMNKVMGDEAVNNLLSLLKYNKEDIARMFGIEDLETNNIIPNSGKLFTDEFIKVLQELEIDGKPFLQEGDSVNLHKLLETIPSIAKAGEDRVTTFGPFEEYFDDEMKDFFIRDSMVTRFLERLGEHFGLKVSQIEAQGHTALYDYMSRFENFNMSAQDWRAIGPDRLKDPAAYKEWIKFIEGNFIDKNLKDFSVKRYVPRIVVKLNDEGVEIDEGLIIGKEAWIFGPSKRFEEKRTFSSIQDLLDAGFNIKSYHDSKQAQMANRIKRIMTRVLSNEHEAMAKDANMATYGFGDSVKDRKARVLLERELFETADVDYEKLGIEPRYSQKFMQDLETKYREDAELEADGQLTKKQLNKIVNDRIKLFKYEATQEVLDQNKNPILLTRILENRDRYASIRYLDTLVQRYTKMKGLDLDEASFSLKDLEEAMPNLLKEESANTSNQYRESKWKYIVKNFNDLARIYGDEFPALKRITTPAIYETNNDDLNKFASMVWEKFKKKREWGAGKTFFDNSFQIRSLADVKIAIKLSRILDLYNNGKPPQFDENGQFLDFEIPVEGLEIYPAFKDIMQRWYAAINTPTNIKAPLMDDNDEMNIFLRKILFDKHGDTDHSKISVQLLGEEIDFSRRDFETFMGNADALIANYSRNPLKYLETRRLEAEAEVKRVLPKMDDYLDIFKDRRVGRAEPVGTFRNNVNINGRSINVLWVNDNDWYTQVASRSIESKYERSLKPRGTKPYASGLVGEPLGGNHAMFDPYNGVVYINESATKRTWENIIKAGDYQVNDYRVQVPAYFNNYDNFINHILYHEIAHHNSEAGNIAKAITENGAPVPLGEKFLIFTEQPDLRMASNYRAETIKPNPNRKESRTDEEAWLRRQMDKDVLTHTRTKQGVYFSTKIPTIANEVKQVIEGLSDEDMQRLAGTFWDQTMLNSADKIKVDLAAEIGKDQSSIYLSPVSREDYLKEIEEILYQANLNSSEFRTRIAKTQDVKPPQRLVITASRDFGITKGQRGRTTFTYDAQAFRDDEKFATEILDAWIEKYGIPEVIIHGGAEGGDRLIASIARKKGISLKMVEPDYNLFPPKRAPLERNKNMIDNYGATHLLVFPARREPIQKPRKIVETRGKDRGKEYWVTERKWENAGGTEFTKSYATKKNLPVTDFSSYMGKPYGGIASDIPREEARNIIRNLRSQRKAAVGGRNPDRTRGTIFNKDLHYRVDSKGDAFQRQFSARSARFKNGTILEDVWQLDIKAKGTKGRAQWVKMGGTALTGTKDNPKTGAPIMEGRTVEMIDQLYEDLWRRYFKENPNLLPELAERSAGKALYDEFSPVAPRWQNQAATITKLLDEQYPLPKSNLTKQSIVKRFTGNVLEAENNPKQIYVFGDNLEEYLSKRRPRSKAAGQAIIRGLANAFGIPTKNSPATHAGAYWTDATFDDNVIAIEKAIKAIEDYADKNDYPINIPWDTDNRRWNIGTGRARLANNPRAVRTFDYLQNRLTKLAQDREYNIREGELKKLAREEANKQLSELGGFDNINQIDADRRIPEAKEYYDKLPDSHLRGESVEHDYGTIPRTELLDTKMWKGEQSRNISNLLTGGASNKENFNFPLNREALYTFANLRLNIEKRLEDIPLEKNLVLSTNATFGSSANRQTRQGHYFDLNYFNPENGYNSPYMSEPRTGYRLPVVQDMIQEIEKRILNKTLSKEDEQFLKDIGFMAKKSLSAFLTPENKTDYIFNHDFFNLNKFTNSILRGKGFDYLEQDFNYRKRFGDYVLEDSNIEEFERRRDSLVVKTVLNNLGKEGYPAIPDDWNTLEFLGPEHAEYIEKYPIPNISALIDVLTNPEIIDQPIIKAAWLIKLDQEYPEIFKILNNESKKYRQLTVKERLSLNDAPYISKLEQRRHLDRIAREKNSTEYKLNIERMLTQQAVIKNLKNINDKIKNLELDKNPVYADHNSLLNGFKAMATDAQRDYSSNMILGEKLTAARYWLEDYAEQAKILNNPRQEQAWRDLVDKLKRISSQPIYKDGVATRDMEGINKMLEDPGVRIVAVSDSDMSFQASIHEPLNDFLTDNWRINDAVKTTAEPISAIPGMKDTLRDLSAKLEADKLYFEDKYTQTIGVGVDEAGIDRNKTILNEGENVINIGGLGHNIYKYDVNDPVSKQRFDEINADIERIYTISDLPTLAEWLGKFNSIQRLTALGIDGSPLTIHLLALAFFSPQAWAGAGRGFFTRLWAALKDPEARRARDQQFEDSEAKRYIESVFGFEVMFNRSGAFEITEALEDGGILAKIGQTRIGGAIQEAVTHSLNEAGRMLAMSMADHAVKVNTWTVTHPTSGMVSKIPKRILDRVSYLDPKTGDRRLMNDIGEYVNPDWNKKPYDVGWETGGDPKSMEWKISRDLLDDEAYQEWALERRILTGRDVTYLRGLGRERVQPFNHQMASGKIVSFRPKVLSRSGKWVGYDDSLDSVLPHISKEYDSYHIKELAQFINSIRGLANSADMGVGPKQRLYESIFLLAPRYRRAVAAHYGKLWSGDPVTRSMAQKSLLQFYAGMTFTVLSLQAMQSMLEGDSEEQMINKITNILDPQSSTFMLFEVDGQKVGPGSKFISDLRVVAKMSNYLWKEATGQEIDDWEDVTSINRNNPAIKWVRAQLAASPSESIDFVLGKDFIGEPAYRGKNSFEFIKNSARPLSENVIPLWLQSTLLEGSPDGLGWGENVRNRTIRGTSEFMGLRAFPQGVTSILKESSYDVFNKGYSTLEPFEKEILRVISSDKLSWLQEKQLQRATSDFAIYFGDVDRINEEFQKSILAYMDIYPDTTEGNRDLYYRYGLLKNYRRGQLAEIGADIEFDEHDTENEDPIIQALAKYNSLFDNPDIKVKGTQIINWEKYDELYDAMMSEMSIEQQLAIQRNSNRLPLPERFLQRLSRIGTGKEYQKIMASQLLREESLKLDNKPELAELYRRYFLMLED